MWYIIRNDHGDSNDNYVDDYIVEADSSQEAITKIGDDAVRVAIERGIPESDLILEGDETKASILYYPPRPEEFEEYEDYEDNPEHNDFSLEVDFAFNTYEEAYAYAKKYFYFHGIYDF